MLIEMDSNHSTVQKKNREYMTTPDVTKQAGEDQDSQQQMQMVKESEKQQTGPS